MLWLAPFLCGLITPTYAHGPDPDRPGLTRQLAESRAARVTAPRYAFELWLDAQAETFRGRAVIDFGLRQVDAPLALDFNGGSVQSLRVNGRVVAPNYDGRFIHLAAADLRTGDNRVAVQYQHPYNSNGVGLHRFRDPEDGRVYLYSDFQPYDANRVFPCFDQPDLKGRFRLTVHAPAAWTVVSAMPETHVRRGKHRATWQFPETPPLPTYIFSVHAGPYHMWQGPPGRVPLRLFARRSLARHVPAAEWFTVTQQGLAYFEELFGMPYPFSKYDQLIVPDFNSAAMENAGAATFAEFTVKRGPTTRAHREMVAVYQLHELAHMWFGNLVTLRWWNDLWLNESFATFMGVLASAEATEFTDAWHRYFLRGKQRAYRAARLPGARAVVGRVADTEGAFASFGAITYQQGASALVQLSHRVGQEAFRQGVRDYLRRYAWANADHNDFLRSIEAAAKTSLTSWASDWLHTAGLNRISTELRCAEGKVQRLWLRQRPTAAGRLRGHRLQVGLYTLAPAGGLQIERVLAVDLAGAEQELPQAVGLPCPHLVFPNHGDWTFADVALARDALTLGGAITQLPDPLLRSQLWQALWRRLEAGEYELGKYLESLLDSFAGEEDEKVAVNLSKQLSTALDWLAEAGAQAALEHYAERAEAVLWRRLHSESLATAQRPLWIDRLVRSTYTPFGLERLAALLRGVETIRDLNVDADRRWKLVVRLNAFAHGDYAALTRAEARRDTSDRGRKYRLAAEAARPDPAVKRRWLQEIIALERPLAELRAAMSQLFPAHQRELHRDLAEEVLAALPRVASAPSQHYQRLYARYLVPKTCAERIPELEGVDEKALGPVFRRAVREAKAYARRCRRATQSLDPAPPMRRDAVSNADPSG